VLGLGQSKNIFSQNVKRPLVFYKMVYSFWRRKTFPISNSSSNPLSLNTHTIAHLRHHSLSRRHQTLPDTSTNSAPPPESSLANETPTQPNIEANPLKHNLPTLIQWWHYTGTRLTIFEDAKKKGQVWYIHKVHMIYFLLNFENSIVWLNCAFRLFWMLGLSFIRLAKLFFL